MTDLTKAQIKQQLIAAYDTDAQRRLGNASTREDWKLTARQDFVDILKRENKRSVLEIGAGAGVDAAYFKAASLDVLATDLSPKMVEACRAQGLPAQILDIYQLDTLSKKYDAIYSLNVLLHIPRHDLPQVLHAIADALQSEGLFYYGVYGGHTREEVVTDAKRVNLPRFFSFLDDATLLAAVTPNFEVIDKRVIQPPTGESGLHFQSLLLRKR